MPKATPKKKPLNDKILYIEKRPEKGDFAARLGKSGRASVTGATQKEAAEKAAAMHPGAAILGARVRHTDGGDPDQWRRLYPAKPKPTRKKKPN